MQDKSEPDINDFSIEDYGEEDVTGLNSSNLVRAKEEKNIVTNSYYPELINNVRALSRYLSDKNVKWYKKSIVAATLAYFAKPKNTLQNWNEFFDYLEEMGIIEKAVKFLGKEIKNYY